MLNTLNQVWAIITQAWQFNTETKIRKYSGWLLFRDMTVSTRKDL